MATWRFMPQRPGETTREPIQGEFFATEAISNSAAALVREGGQNALDAGRGEGPVRVRVAVTGPAGGLAPAGMAPYLAGAWPHYQAHQNGLREVPAAADPCPVLVFEDFGTRGLCGDPLQWHKQEGVKNGFFTFFRAEGQSDKEKGDRGRWGVGKFVFPRSSRVSSLLAVTVRHDDGRRLLLGRAVLKTHAVDGVRYVADGYFGEPVAVPGGTVVGPVEDAALIDQFCAEFGLTRGSEPGLSVVVPWYDADITPAALLRAVVEDYFDPILCGGLEVTVEGPDGATALTAATLIPELEARPDAADLRPLVRLAAWLRAPAAVVELNRMKEVGPPKWGPELFPDEAATALRERYQKGERVAVRVPFCVRPKGRERQWSHFDVALEREPDAVAGRPVFVREGLVISDLAAPLCRGARALVVCDDGPLATLLGDAENPAHTQWQKDGSNYKGKYTYPAENLSFVVQSVAKLIGFITEADKAADKTLLVDVFSLPAEPDDPDAVPGPDGAGGGPKKGKASPTVPELPPPTPPQFRVEAVPGGFRVRPGAAAAGVPARLDVRVAYGTRTGSPLKKYKPADFELGRAPVVVGATGVVVKSQGRNALAADVTAADFQLTVAGFDETRDLYVQVTAPGEARDGDPAA